MLLPLLLSVCLILFCSLILACDVFLCTRNLFLKENKQTWSCLDNLIILYYLFLHSARQWKNQGIIAAEKLLFDEVEVSWQNDRVLFSDFYIAADIRLSIYCDNIPVCVKAYNSERNCHCLVGLWHCITSAFLQVAGSLLTVLEMNWNRWALICGSAVVLSNLVFLSPVFISCHNLKFVQPPY